MSILSELGIRANDLLAGFLGGVTALFVNRTTSPWEAVGLVVSGALTANYLTEPAVRLVGLNPGATGFIVGLCAMAIAHSLMTAARTWRPRLPGSGQSPPSPPPPPGGGS